MSNLAEKFPIAKHGRQKAADKTLCLKMVREHARKARTIDEEAHLILRKMQEERERLEALMDSSAVKMEYWRNQLKGLRKKWEQDFDESQRWQRAADKIYVKRHK